MNLKRLKTYPFPKSLLHVLQKLARHGFEAYVVGGAVRDILLDLVPHEYDVATCALPAQSKVLFVPTSKRGEAFGSIMIRTYGKNYELTTYREEFGYSDHRHPDRILFVTDIHRDLVRRDFTINALAYSPVTQTLIDDHEGLRDLKRKQLCCIGNPLDRFNEDALRIIRALQLSQRLGFTLCPATNDAILARSELLVHLPAGRLRTELKGVHLANYPRIQEIFRGCTEAVQMI